MSNARALTLTPGAAPALLLTDFRGDNTAPMTIINDSQDRAYLGSDSSVGPANSTPLDPGTAMPWTTPGPIWAVADPSATKPVTLRATDDIDAWTPSPYAVAAATAARLLATGVPNVITSDLLLAADVAPGQTITVNTAKYAAVVITVPSATPAGNIALFAAQSVAGSQTTADTLGDYVVPGFTRTPRWTLATQGDTLTLTNTGTNTARVRIVGTNRLPRAALDNLDTATLIAKWSISSQPYTAGQQQPFARDVNSSVPAAAGEADMYAALGSASTIATAQIAMFDASNNGVFIADSAEPAAFTSAGGLRTVVKRICVPAGATFAYVARSAGTFAPTLRLVYRPV